MLLQIKSVWRAFLLSVQNALLRLLEVLVGDLHAALAQSHEASFGADSFDVGAGQVVLGHDQLGEIDVGREGHFRCVDVEDASLGLLIGQRELDLAINSTGTDQGRVESLNAIRRHDDFDIAARIKTVELIEQLQHRSLDFTFAA